MTAGALEVVARFQATDGAELLAVRAQPAHLGFVVGTWVDSYSQALARQMGASSLEALPGPVRLGILDMLQTRVRATVQEASALVALSPEAPEVCLGHVVTAEVTSGPVCVHYVYTVHPARRVGIASGLLEAAGAHGGRCTCYTAAGLGAIRRFGLRITTPKPEKRRQHG